MKMMTISVMIVPIRPMGTSDLGTPTFGARIHPTRGAVAAT